MSMVEGAVVLPKLPKVKVHWNYSKSKGWTETELKALRNALIGLGSGAMQTIRYLFPTKSNIQLNYQIRSMFGQQAIRGMLYGIIQHVM
jgi:hypothetical protein